jgi:beta-glucanase (GH16 family)
MHSFARPLLAIAFAATCPAFAETKAAPEAPAPIRDQGYRLVFQDEFDGAKDAPPDPAKWHPVVMPGKWRDGWNSKECARLDGQGNLRLITRKNEAENRYETGYISTSGKFEATHGYFECRCRLQKQPGFWSAFWIQTPTMGKPVGDGATAGVEIDVMEYIHGGPYYFEKGSDHRKNFQRPYSNNRRIPAN